MCYQTMRIGNKGIQSTMHSVRQIEIVRALAKHRHFGLAAKALGVSQPALTRSLKQLESELTNSASSDSRAKRASHGKTGN